MLNGQQLIVQMKASEEAPVGNSVAVTLKVRTLNYLRNMLDVALIVKYVAAEKEAYWLLLKDFVKDLPEGPKSVTMRIPRINRLSANPWRKIAEHVEAVHYRKLRANAH